jgi:hypothetical protein
VFLGFAFWSEKSSPFAREVTVQYSSVLESVNPPQAERKPRLISFDSGQEFSLENYLAVYKLVEREDLEGYVFDESCLRIPE